MMFSFKNIFKKEKREKLIMTIVCQNEIEIIEKMIRFHLKMGVDGIIVTDHRSTDGTRELLHNLKDQGLVLEVIEQNGVDHLHSKFTTPMINLAKDKYNAKWIISADADEFYFARSKNLKKELDCFENINCLKVYSNWYFPEENDFELGRKRALFVKNPLYLEDYQLNNIEYNDITAYYQMFECPKVIFKAKDFIEISDGNHDVKLIDKQEASPAGIVLYHYHTRSYKHYEDKAIKAQSVIFNKDPNWSKGWKRSLELYEKGGLKDFYEQRFGKEIKEKLIKLGVICIDTKVADFLYKENIL